ncbi:Uncharacterised protein [Yersinia frederiksenii]|nr:Uncharacterised protein [Yersinia frederiksenii]
MMPVVTVGGIFVSVLSTESVALLTMIFNFLYPKGYSYRHKLNYCVSGATKDDSL